MVCSRYIGTKTTVHGMEYSTSPKKVKFRETISAKKSCALCFLIGRGCLRTFCHGMTVNAETYWDSLNKLRRANKRSTRGSSNPRSYRFIWLGTTWSPPYSLDLASSDYHLFLHLKEYCGGQRYHVKTAVLQWLANQATDLYEDGIQKLIVRYERALM